MKKYEKLLLVFFSGIAVLFVANILYRRYVLGIELDFRMFDEGTTALAWAFIISFFVSMVILVSWRLRKRYEAGKKPISGLYRASFWLSFIPFVLLMIGSVSSMWEGFTFLSDTVYYGAEAFWGTFTIYGIFLFGVIIPVFPVMIFWQLLYLVKRRKYRKLMKAGSK